MNDCDREWQPGRSDCPVNGQPCACEKPCAGRVAVRIAGMATVAFIALLATLTLIAEAASR